MTIGAARPREALLAHVQTWRPYTVWYVGLLGLAGAGLLDDGQHSWRLLLAWGAPTLGWVGGHYLGDYFDRHLDAISKPHRPIPSGRLAPGTALVSGVACMLAVVVLSVAGGVGTVVLAALAVAGIVGYGRALKARGISGNLTRGALGALTVAFGAVSVDSSRLTVSSLAVVAFALAVWAHDTSSNLVGTLRDMHGDRQGGYRTVPVRRGAWAASRTALYFYASFVAAAVVGGLLPASEAGVGRRLLYFTVLASALVLGTRAWRIVLTQRSRVRAATALRAHELLVIERIGFASAIIVLGFGALAAAVLVAPMLIATWWTQARMRVGYELGPAGTGAPPPVPVPGSAPSTATPRPAPEPNSI